MISIPVLMVLLFSIWTMVLLVFTVGIYRWGSVFKGKAQLKDFPADDVKGSDFYKRAMRAHANCVENLPIFVALVFAAHATNTITNLVCVLSVIVITARVLQSLVHVIFTQGNRVIFVRFTLFLTQLICFFGIALSVIKNNHIMAFA